ncbi:MAG: hypothetical protein HFG10_12890 [Oscillibacter sp.]|jgi:hypothetical protein|nr:hypothetical protein [Oscillibacter sp.]
MQSYTFKTYISNRREHFYYGRGTSLTKKDFPFPESLLKLLRLDIWKYEPMIKDMEQALLRFYQAQDQKDADIILAGLEKLAEAHIYFQQLRLDWQCRFEQAANVGGSALTDLLPRKELTHIPSSIDNMQKQIQRLFQNVLDIELGKKSSVQELMANYYNREGSDSLNTFQFCTLPMKFELVDACTFTEVLYPKTIYDLIDYFLRQCVQREQRMRVCKNCSLYFAVKGRGTAEYCDVTTDEKGRICKEIGAFVHWSQSKEDDEIFKVYRREYKKRFAWTKTGKITPATLYAWGERAREKKAECEEGKITLEEYQIWLKNS